MSNNAKNIVKFTPIILPLAAIMAALIRIMAFGGGIIESLLLFLLVISTGLGGIWAFMGHTFSANDVARSIGWQPGSPFQFEIAIANLGIGILGILCFWFRGSFWAATVIMAVVFGWGAAYGHIRDMRKNKNYAPGNAGPILYITDIVIPLLMLILLIIYMGWIPYLNIGTLV